MNAAQQTENKTKYPPYIKREPFPCICITYDQDGEPNIDRNVIDKTIAEVCERRGITDLKAEKQRPFKAVMSEVGLTLFPGRKALKNNIYMYLGEANKDNPLYSNNNKYNYILINKLLDIYIDICNIYAKVLDHYGFAYFANIDSETINSWQNFDSPNDPRIEIYKKIYNTGEMSLQDAIIDTGQAVGHIAVGNTRYKWSEREQAGITKAKALTLESLPQIEVVKVVDITSETTQTKKSE